MYNKNSTSFKTSLPMLVDTIEKVKKVSVGYVGSNGLFDSATVNAYTASLRGLSATQAEVVLSSAGLDKTQRKQIITALEATAATRTLTGEEALSAMTRKIGSAEAAKELLLKSKLVTTDQLEAGAEFQVSAEKLKSAVSSGILSQSEADNIAVALGLTGANIGLGTSFKLLTASIWANIKALAVWLATNPVGWCILVVAGLSAVCAGYDALINRREKLAREKIEVLSEDISKLDEEISSLESLHIKLEEAKGDKSKLAQIQAELNDAIGETSGLLNAEGEAWDVANAKLKANIALKKQQRKQKQQDKINENKEAFNNNGLKLTGYFGIDWMNPDISGKRMREIAKEAAKLGITGEQWSVLSTLDGNGADFTAEQWEDYWNEQVDYAYEIFEDTIDSYDGAGGQDFVKGIISAAVRSGADLSEVFKIVNEVIDNQDMQDAINKYWVSLVNPDINSEEALRAVNKSFDDIVAKNPALKDFFDGFYNTIVVGGKAVTITSQNDEKTTDSLSKLKEASEKLSSVSGAFKEFSQDGYITLETVSKIKEAVGDSVPNWWYYEESLLSSNLSVEGLKNVMDELMLSVLENQIATNGLKNITEEQVAALLRENGVVNASQKAHEVLALIKAKEGGVAKQYIRSIDAENDWLQKQATEAGLTANAFTYLLTQEILYGNNDLKVDDKISKLKTLARSVLATGRAYANLAILESMPDYDSLDDYDRNGFSQELYNWTKRAGVKVQIETDSGRWIDAEDYDVRDSSVQWKNVGSANKPKQNWRYSYDNGQSWVGELAQLGGEILTKDLFDFEYDFGGNKKSKPSKPKLDNMDYWDLYDEILEDNQHRREKYDEIFEENNKLLDKAVESLDTSKISDLERQIILNNLKEREKLASELEQEQDTLNNKIMPRLIELVPELAGKSWIDISEVDKEKILKKLEQELLDLENQWEKDSYDILSSNGNDKDDANYIKAEDVYESTKKALEIQKDEIDNLFNTAENYSKDIADIGERLSDLDDDYDKTIKTIHDGINNAFSEYEKYINRTTSALQEQADAYDIIINKQQALIDTEQRMYDAQAGVRQIQREITKELRTNKELAEYLDEDTRRLIFNEDDYRSLNTKLKNISKDMGSLTAWYSNQINNLTEENWYLEESITKEYERRLSIKEKEYGIARAELDIEKKKQELNNVLNEKNIRMLVKDTNGYSWKYVHNVEEASKIIGEISDLEGELAESRLQAEQQVSMNEKQLRADMLSSEKAAIENRIKMLNDETEKLSLVIESITDPLLDFGLVIKHITNSIGGKGYDVNTDYSSLIEKAIKTGNLQLAGYYERLRNAKIDGEGLSEKKTYDYHKVSEASTILTSDFYNLGENISENEILFRVLTSTVAETTDSLSVFGKFLKIATNKDMEKSVKSVNNGFKKIDSGLDSISKKLKKLEQEGKTDSYEYKSLVGQYNRRAGRMGIKNYDEPNAAQIISNNTQDNTILHAISKSLPENPVQAVFEQDIKSGHTFDNGGIAKGKGILVKDTNADELVLNPEQTGLFKNVMNNLSDWTSNAILANKFTPSNASNYMVRENKGDTYVFNGDMEFPNVQNAEDFLATFHKGLNHNMYKKN